MELWNILRSRMGQVDWRRHAPVAGSVVAHGVVVAAVAAVMAASARPALKRVEPPPLEVALVIAEPPPVEPEVVAKPDIAKLPKRLIRDDPNDPALNYLDSICRNVRVDDLASRSASAYRRADSAVIDLIFCAVLTSPIAGAFYLSGSGFADTRAWMVLAAALVVVTFLYLTLATALTGRTLGMRLLSLRVIDTKTGLIPTGGQSIGRSFFYLLSLPTVVGILFALVSREGYTAHDRATRTAVVVT